MKILSVECTASPVSVAVIEDGKLLGEFFLNQKTVHSQTLLPMTESVLSLTGSTVSELDAIAVTQGPGSFTGVRIGISAVKGLSFAENKPCVPVSVLEAMAYNFVLTDCFVCSVMDARCNQVYNALFSVENGLVTRLCDDRALMISELNDEFLKNKEKFSKKPVFIVGDGAILYYNDSLGILNNFKLAPECLRYQRASGVGMAAEKLIADGKTVSGEELLPLYLRLPQAERELKAKKGI